MSPAKQRIAIAEACGWKIISHTATGNPYWNDPNGVYRGGGSHQPLPDYLHDLNAMHEVEAMLTTAGEWCRYVDALAEIKSASDWREYGTDAFLLIRATAAQRAEAFLRTLNLWK